jgi:hypothetical protein
MALTLRAFAAAALIISGMGAAGAQSPGGSPPPETSPPPLSIEKQRLIRDWATREKVAPARMSEPIEVGAVVPSEVELHALPQDSVSEVPTVTSYRYFVADGRIVIVDPSTLKVVQLIGR